jgi:autotransporter-associated beta strand protein
MKVFQKITLTALASLAMNMQLSASSPMTIEVDSGTAIASAAINTGSGALTKTGAGALTLGGANTLGQLEINQGQINVSATNNFGGGGVTFDTNAGNILAVTAAGVAVPALTMTAAGELLANGSGNVNLNNAPAGSGALTLASTTPATDTITINAAMAASATPLVVAGHVIAGGASTSTPAAAMTVNSGGILDLLRKGFLCYKFINLSKV